MINKIITKELNSTINASNEQYEYNNFKLQEAYFSVELADINSK